MNWFKQVIFLLVNLWCVVATSQNKDSEYGIFESQDQYYQFMGSIKQEGAQNPELMSMVPMINDIVLGKPIGSTGKQYNALNSTLGLLSDESIRNELEMVDDQYQELINANEAIQKKAAQQLREIDLSDMMRATQQILSIRDQSEKDLKSTLLPHQMKRLKQITARRQLRYRSLGELLTSEPMKSELEISDQQSDQILSSENEINEELEEQIAELRTKARMKLLNQLDRNQRKKVEELLGSMSEVSRQKKSYSQRMRKR
ncbi:MAG: hypothetical protein AAGA30_05785 [Planctomycetota bacterium]